MALRSRSDGSDRRNAARGGAAAMSERSATKGASVVAQVVACLVWVGIVAVPLYFTHNNTYVSTFPKEWYSRESPDERPKPLGLFLGLLAVTVGQMWAILYHWLHRAGYFGDPQAIQLEGAPKYEFREGVITHLSQPEGFVLLGGYLCGTWMFSLMPEAYYSFTGGVDWFRVGGCLLLQDCVQYAMHWLEHKISPEVYKWSHKPHHRFTNPRMFDAFNGSLADTFLMILVPLYLTANLIDCNVWTYMAFGSLYANWLTLIHSEYPHPWDTVFTQLGFGTPADHHVHHKLFLFNFAHLFTYWDRLCGTYRDPTAVKSFSIRVQ